jgi:hypothetical protein
MRRSTHLAVKEIVSARNRAGDTKIVGRTNLASGSMRGSSKQHLVLHCYLCGININDARLQGILCYSQKVQIESADTNARIYVYQYLYFVE